MVFREVLGCAPFSTIMVIELRNGILLKKLILYFTYLHGRINDTILILLPCR